MHSLKQVVTLLALTNYSDVEDTPCLVKAAGRKCHSITADLSDHSVIPFVIEQSVSLAGRVDVLVNIAGIIRREDAIDFSEKDWDDVMDLNVKSVFCLS